MDLPAEEVALEMEGLRQIVAKFANFDGSYIKGARVPFLQTSGDEYYQALVDTGFDYDASRPTRVLMDQGLWPFTYDVDYSDSEFLVSALACLRHFYSKNIGRHALDPID